MIREDPDPENKKRDYYTVVEDLLDNLLQLLSRLLFERETMDGERKRCLAILKVRNPPKSTSSNCLAYLKSKQLLHFILHCGAALPMAYLDCLIPLISCLFPASLN